MVSSTTSSVSTARSLVAPPGVLLLITIIIMAVSPSATARNDAADEYFYNSLYEGSPDSMQARNLDALEKVNVLNQRNLDKIGGGNLLRRSQSDGIDVRKIFGRRRRTLDPLGGGNLLRRSQLGEIGDESLFQKQLLVGKGAVDVDFNRGNCCEEESDIGGIRDSAQDEDYLSRHESKNSVDGGCGRGGRGGRHGGGRGDDCLPSLEEQGENYRRHRQGEGNDPGA